MKISLCMIVKNEEKYIRMCLENAFKLADEAVVVDTGSEDKTIEIIKQFGDKVKLLHYKWNSDFSAARNISLEAATGDWILMLDADEKLICDPAAVRKELEDSKLEGYEIPLYNIITQQTIVYSSVYCKIFRNKGYKYEGAIHEQIDIKDRFKNIKPIDKNICSVIHYGYIENEVKERNKAKRNLDILMKEKEKKPNDPFIYYNLGVCYEIEAKYKDALDNFFNCNELAKKYDKYSITEYEVDMVKRMSECYYGLEEYQLCADFINDLVKDRVFKEYVDLHFILANCYINLKKYEAAIKALNKCIEIGETSKFVSIKGRGSYQPKFLMAQVYVKMGKVHDAVMQYIEAIFDPNNIMKFGIDEAREYMRINNYTQVLSEFDRLLGITKDKGVSK